MSYQNSHIGKVYYHVMKGSRYILADERNKKKLLDTVFHIYQENRWRMYAFCVTDDSAHFMAEAETYQAVRRETGRACDEFFRRCGEKIPHVGGTVPGLCGCGYRELDSSWKAACCSRYIHRLPLEEGYAARPEDYWWSSYNTYAGNYEWEQVDCRMVLQYFSLNPEKARKKMIFYTCGSIIKNEQFLKK